VTDHRPPTTDHRRTTQRLGEGEGERRREGERERGMKSGGQSQST
jgi:hypothetical protein